MKKFKKYYSLVLAILLTLSSCVSSQGIDVKTVDDNFEGASENVLDHSDWDKLLKAHVKENGLVDYKGFKSDKEKLTAYTTYLSQQMPDKSWTAAEQLAYFINVYNANTIKLIVDNYPVKSIKDIDATISPFLKNIIKIGDKDLSLADVEKGILQKMNEPRIHFAINCASISCPKLLRDAYTAKNVDQLMDRAAKEFINSDKNEISENNAKVSEIFKWYKKDFLNESSSIIDYINQYSDTKINSNVELDYIEYNWDLNDVE
ncbi:DUF547 domain-containing protein [Winogradskyella ursingii]|uniref:DUF547 domain-containing protein n=1 Tax=Winogradskyella ursingii TaxID=2686079 RepID=UPI0015C98333|nr:DUF547 domain-containing protein [Winogradskyella ursingii]